MATITDRDLDIALRYALQNCFEEEIEEMDDVNPADYPVNIRTEKRFNHDLKKALRMKTWNFTIPCPLKKATIIVLVVATVFFTAMLATPTVRAAVWDVIVKWYDQFIGIKYSVDEKDPEQIEDIILPSDLPNGWDIESITTNNTMALHRFTNQKGQEIRLSQHVVGEDDEWWLDNTDVEIESVILSKGVRGQCYLYEDTVILVWRDLYVFVIRGDLVNREEIIKIALNMTAR